MHPKMASRAPRPARVGSVKQCARSVKMESVEQQKSQEEVVEVEEEEEAPEEEVQGEGHQVGTPKKAQEEPQPVVDMAAKQLSNDIWRL